MPGFCRKQKFKPSFYSANLIETLNFPDNEWFLIITRIPINIYSLFMRRRKEGKYNSLLYVYVCNISGKIYNTENYYNMHVCFWSCCCWHCCEGCVVGWWGLYWGLLLFLCGMQPQPGNRIIPMFYPCNNFTLTWIKIANLLPPQRAPNIICQHKLQSR